MSVFGEVVKVLEPSLRSVAPYTLTRLLLRAGVFEREAMTVSDLQKAMPHVEAGLREVMSPGELAAAMAQMNAIIGR